MNSIQLVISNEVHEVMIKEYQGQRVVTFRDIDNLHQRKAGTAARNFQSNREYFVEGEDYIVVQPSQKDEFRFFQIPNRGITLLTESGYLMLVKSFTDKLAWAVQRQLLNAYFKIKEIAKREENLPTELPTTVEDILLLAVGSMKEMKTRIAQLEQDKQEQTAEIRKLSLVVDNEIHLTDTQCADIQEAVKSRVGHLMSKGYDSHFQSIFSALKVHFTVPKYNKIRRGDFDKAMDFIRGWYPKKNNEAN